MLRFFVVCGSSIVAGGFVDYQYAASVMSRFQRRNPGESYEIKHRV